MVKIGIGFAIAAIAGAVLVVAATGARERGRNTYCRNNLRKLGELAHGKERTTAGRAFWQEVREEMFTNEQPGGKQVWIVRFGGLNPFGCPVRGVQPIDLSKLSEPDLARHMSDPMTIDYRGPKLPGDSPAPRPEPLGGDLDGNHPGGEGYVLLFDSSVIRVRDALQVKSFGEAPEAAAGLTE